MLWGIICDVILRHNNNNKCQHRHIIVQQNVIFSILVSPHNQQSFSFKIFSRAKVGKIQSCHHGKTEQQRSNLQMREIILGEEKKNYFYEETLNIFCVKSLSSQFDIFSVD